MGERAVKKKPSVNIAKSEVMQMKNRNRAVAILLIALLLLTSVALPSFAQNEIKPQRGDVNGDGKISSADARQALRGAAKLIRLSEEEFERCDVNGDGKTTSADARIILRGAARLETEYAFEAQYIRTNGIVDGAQYPAVTVIRDRESLDAYYENHKTAYDLERHKTVVSDTTIGFLDACDKYDGAFFASRELILILLEESSGSYSHRVSRVVSEVGGLAIYIDRLLPGAGNAATCDMAEWHVFVEVEKGLVRRGEDVAVYIGAVTVPDASGMTEATADDRTPGTTVPGDKSAAAEPSAQATSVPPTSGVPKTPVAFEAQYIRTNGYSDSVQYPIVTTVKNRAELDAYYAKYKGTYDLERHERVYSDTTVGFLDACDRYDDAFFEKNDLILVLTEEPSGSIRHTVESVQGDAVGGLEIVIGRTCPYVATCDMAEWHIMIEVAKDPAHPGRDLAVTLEDIVYDPDPFETAPPTEPAPADTTAAPTKPANGACAFQSQIIRTNGWSEGTVYPVVTVVKNRAELDEYYKNNKDLYSFDNAYGDDCAVSFLDACGRYDDAFFDAHELVLVALQEGSGSIRHRLTGVSAVNGGLRIDIQSVCPSPCTCDMAQWHVFVELEKGVAPDAEKISVATEATEITSGESMEAYLPVVEA